MTDYLKPKVGVGGLIVKDGKILMSRRKNAHGSGQLAFPGGHLENLESFEACARRETLEECGVEIKNVRFFMLYNMTAYAPKHYVHVTMIADWASGEPANLEPDKSEFFKWMDLDEIREPMFDSARVSLEHYCVNNWPCFIDSV